MFMNSYKLHIKDTKKKATIIGNSLQNCSSTVNLAELECGNSARVLNLEGSRAMIGRLEAMGILQGSIITKKSAIPAKGPIIVEKGTIQFALGYDMALNILVEPIKQEV